MTTNKKHPHKGDVTLPNIQEFIKKFCTFIFVFSDINTVFIDKDQHVVLEYGYNAIPEPLQPYLGDLGTLSFLQQSNNHPYVSLHSTSYHLNFVTAEVYDNQAFLGTIIIGPYLLDEPTSLMVENVLFENKLSISLKHLIKEYYNSLPLLSSYKAKLIAESLVYSLSSLDSLANNNIQIATAHHTFEAQLQQPLDILTQTNELANNSIEQSYLVENKLIHAIAQGDKERAEELSSDIISLVANLPDRIPHDPLRSRKNLTFVLNTLLRKAAEEGGLHPTKIHSISKKFAIQIETSNSIQEIINLQKNMIATYCNSTYKYSLKGYNYLIRSTIEYIRINLDQDLSLLNISEALNISPHELSRQFKKETDIPITHYINNLRINEAVYFLENQAMSITDIAHMVGFNDVNYFTKVFKKTKGVTPSKYRKNKS